MMRLLMTIEGRTSLLDADSTLRNPVEGDGAANFWHGAPFQPSRHRF
jgi:hypothetical protein